MPTDVERFIRVQRLAKVPGRLRPEWHTIPNCFRLRVWEMTTAEAIDDGDDYPEAKRFIFHIAYVDGIARGCKVTYLGEDFAVLGVSDSTRLRGLELRCAPEVVAA